MKPASPDMAEMLHRVRQQLILAQVRIMELEDVRDETASKLESVEGLLAGAQTLADQKIDEASHLENVRSELQAQYEHMRHMQHITNEALNQARAQAESVETQRKQLQLDVAALQVQIVQISENLNRVQSNLGESQTLAQIRADQIVRLETELHAIHATRSWRWTGWLRAIARKLGSGHA
jgi:chromosome segregation ATPase